MDAALGLFGRAFRILAWIAAGLFVVLVATAYFMFVAIRSRLEQIMETPSASLVASATVLIVLILSARSLARIFKRQLRFLDVASLLTLPMMFWLLSLGSTPFDRLGQPQLFCAERPDGSFCRSTQGIDPVTSLPLNPINASSAIVRLLREGPAPRRIGGDPRATDYFSGGRPSVFFAERDGTCMDAFDRDGWDPLSNKRLLPATELLVREFMRCKTSEAERVRKQVDFVTHARVALTLQTRELELKRRQLSAAKERLRIEAGARADAEATSRREEGMIGSIELARMNAAAAARENSAPMARQLESRPSSPVILARPAGMNAPLSPAIRGPSEFRAGSATMAAGVPAPLLEVTNRSCKKLYFYLDNQVIGSIAAGSSNTFLVPSGGHVGKVCASRSGYGCGNSISEHFARGGSYSRQIEAGAHCGDIASL